MAHFELVPVCSTFVGYFDHEEILARAYESLSRLMDWMDGKSLP